MLNLLHQTVRQSVCKNSSEVSGQSRDFQSSYGIKIDVYTSSNFLVEHTCANGDRNVDR